MPNSGPKLPVVLIMVVAFVVLLPESMKVCLLSRLGPHENLCFDKERRISDPHRGPDEQTDLGIRLDFWHKVLCFRIDARESRFENTFGEHHYQYLDRLRFLS